MTVYKCPNCNSIMNNRVYDEEEGRYYYECRNVLPNGEICWRTVWE